MNDQLFRLIKKDKESKDLFGRSTQYYLKTFKYNQVGSWFLSWNWACFFSAFFGVHILWFFYRRMYVYGLIAFGIVILFNLLQLAFSSIIISIFGSTTLTSLIMKILTWILGMIWYLGMGLLGNTVYGIHLQRKLDAGKISDGVDIYSALIAGTFVSLVFFIFFTKIL